MCRLLKLSGLFWQNSLSIIGLFPSETWQFMEPTNLSMVHIHMPSVISFITCDMTLSWDMTRSANTNAPPPPPRVNTHTQTPSWIRKQARQFCFGISRRSHRVVQRYPAHIRIIPQKIIDKTKMYREDQYLFSVLYFCKKNWWYCDVETYPLCPILKKGKIIWQRIFQDFRNVGCSDYNTYIRSGHTT